MSPDGRRLGPRAIASAAWWAARIALLAVLGTGCWVSVMTSGVVGLELLLAYAGAGAYLAVRRPGNLLGWLLVLAGFGLGLGTAQVRADSQLLLAGPTDPGEALAAWASGAGFSLAFIGITGIVVLFPSGRLPAGQRGWSWLLGGALTLLLACLIAFGPIVPVRVLSGEDVNMRNPLALVPAAAFWRIVPETAMLYAGMFAIFLVGAAGLLGRFVRATGWERLQYRWLVAAIVVVGATTGVWATLDPLLHSDLAGIAFAAAMVAYTAVPIAIGVAVLRYRLYDIDRVISRTVAYAMVTAILGAIFAGLVIGLQSLALPLIRSSDLAVAVSTLVVAALFGPLRRRVQDMVDRRFDRARYDSVRVAEGFGTRLRHGLDLDDVSAELAATTLSALRPASVSVWVRSRIEGRGKTPASGDQGLEGANA